MSTPLLSVVMPAYRGVAMLPHSLSALAASDLPRDRWELIVVDDASDDSTAAVAGKWADRILILTGRPRGPGHARNRGTESAVADWIVFIDADVAVHRETLGCILDAIEAHPTVDAFFGAYDESPPAAGFLSQYRNLLHRFIHVTAAGPTETFWAGCGAVRRSCFNEVGGFDERRYPRPQIEDIELGYRLRDRGYRIAIVPAIQGAHLKRWHFLGSLRTDLLDRGIPWVTLLLERRSLGSLANLNLKRGERAKTALVGLACALLLVALATRQPVPAVVAGMALLGVTLSNWPMLSWFAARRGPLFALGVVPFNLLYYVISGISVAAGLGLHLFRSRQATADADDVPLRETIENRAP